MSLWKIAWRSIQQRGVASLLTSLSMALGVMLVVSVLSIHGVISQSFRNNSSLGYNMIVGAKGGKLQLTLNSVFYLSQPIENIPYDYYLEFLDPAHRAAEYRHSVQRQANDLLWQIRQIEWIGSTTPTGNVASIYQTLIATEWLRQVTQRNTDLTILFAHLNRPVVPMEAGRPGRFSQFTNLAIPLCLGDYFHRFRVVGTTPDFFDKLTFGPEGTRTYQFAAGRNLEHHSEKYGYFEAIVGATVAAELDLKLGDRITTTHGDPEQGGESHGTPFSIVGILAPSGTPNDRAAFINIEGFYLMKGHAKPLEESDNVLPTGLEQPTETGHQHGRYKPLPVEQREVTAVLVRTVSGEVVPGLQNTINEDQVAQAVLPILEIYRLFDAFVRPIQRVLLALTVMICIVSGISILVSIYNSMSDRRHEIGVMRALGASRNVVMSVILIEAIMLSMAGGVLGWTMGHTINALASSRIEQQTGVSIGFWTLAPPVKLAEALGADPDITWLEHLRVSSELLLVPGLILLAVVVGIFPAITAYRTDVAQALER